MKNLTPGVYEFDYLLENKFFVDIDGDQVQKGKVQVHLTLKRSSMSSELDFHSEGVVMVPCDRCLDDMEQPIETDNRLIVKFGSEYAEESDEVLIIPEDDGTLNIAWFLYEFIALAIPMKHVHAPGKCNKAMAAKFKQHRARNKDDEEELDDMDDMGFSEPGGATDPRWDALKGLFENDNN
mgnify:FL=1